MPNKGQKMGGINDSVLWQKEWKRQFFAVKTALNSLRRQTDERREGRGSTAKAVKEMAFHFGLVDEAFEVMNRPEPEEVQHRDYFPAPKGRRQFLSDLKHGDGGVRT